MYEATRYSATTLVMELRLRREAVKQSLFDTEELEKLSTTINRSDIMTFKIMNKNCPRSFLDKYKPRPSFPSYNTRDGRNLLMPMYRGERHKMSFHYSALKDWNNSAINIRELPILNTFKRQLKTYLKSKT